MSEKRKLNDEEQKIIARVEKYEGRKLSDQEVSLTLKQAQALGEL